MGEDHTAEPTAIKKQKDQPIFDDEHVYDSTNQLSKGQTVTPPINNGNNDYINGEADGSKHTYHSLEQSENGNFSNPESHSISTGHQRTICQEDANSLSGDCDPTLYNCQFDDPMYESTPHPRADQTVTAAKSELKDDELATPGNPELPVNHGEDAKNLPSVYDMFDDPIYI
jgi:hypothetical protein